MAALQNQHHEAFAREIAKGSTGRDAYRVAGFNPKSDDSADACASRLLATARVKARVRELQTKAAERTATTIESITNNLVRIAKGAEAEGGASGLSVARAAWVDVAKINGLIVDKSEVLSKVHAISAEPMTSEEWAAQYCDERK
ncbi:MAG TPA: terminase small subunit [Roseiarcus sp.]|nr:terminase small subunit [Roseiarcus sp.]